jgi:hypothetical protein
MSDQPAAAPKPRSAWRTSPALWAIVILALFLLYRLVIPREDPLERFRRDLLAAVPIGATQAEVIAWAQRHGKPSPLQSWNLDDPGLPPGRTMPEAAGVPRADLVSFAEVGLPWGTYVIRNEVADNRLWVFLTFDKDGRVKGHYFLTLEGLAAIEQARAAEREAK